MIKNKTYLFFCFLFLFFSCNEDKSVIDPNIIFSTNGKEYYLNGAIVYQKNEKFYAAYDDVRKKYWMHHFADNYSSFYEINKDGKIIDTRKVFVSDAVVYNGNFFVTDNKFLLHISNEEEYIIIDIDLQESIIFKRPASKKYFEITGFSGEIFFTERWYYNINTDVVEYFPDEISHCRYQSAIDKVIGISEQGTLSFFDLTTKKIIDLGIENNTSWNHYYAFNESSIYYTKNKRKNIGQAFWSFFYDIRPVYWYRYDFDKKNEIKIFCPGDFPRILGSVVPTDTKIKEERQTQ